MMKKVWNFLSSMRFAILLLVILALACAGGSFITQGQTLAWYTSRYSERTAALIVALRLDDVFHSWWFLLLTAFLCGNLLLCNLLRLKPLLSRTKNARVYVAAETPTVSAEISGDPEPVFERLHMKAPQHRKAVILSASEESDSETGDSSSQAPQNDRERDILFSSKNAVGHWGAWVCHLGILLLIVGFALGQMTHKEYSVYGVPGQTKPIGDSGLTLTIDSFTVDLRDDDTVAQYEAGITVSDGNRSESASVRVNEPADLFGLRFYQNSTGWAAGVSVLKEGELIQQELLCAGEFTPIKDLPELVLLFNAFYPDYVMVPGEGPKTASGQLNHPGYLYSLYYDEELVGMNVLEDGEVITVDDYTIVFSDPQSYTLIQAKRDRFTPLALLGGLIVLLGLVLSFYVQPKKLWAIETERGWTVYGQCRKGAALFREQVLEACAKQVTGER